MGADLCGYILCGPGVLNKRKIAKARKRLEGLEADVKVLQHLLEDLNEEGKEPGEDFVPKRIREVVDDFMDVRYGEVGAALYEEAFEVLSSITEGFDGFIDMWGNQGYRDIMSRTMPGRKGWIILVVGERTWGDGPEPDSAWGLCDLMAELGVFSDLGIR